MSTAITPIGERTAVDIPAIERELSDLWRQATEGSPEALTRVCVLNLVIVASSDSEAQHASEAVISSMPRYPSRAIVIHAKPEQEDRFGAWVQANCTLPSPSRPQVCCEQITIEAGGAAIARTAGTVLPLLVPDVPVALWWISGAPFENELFRKLAPQADHVIVNSTTFSNKMADLAQLANWFDRGPAITDLSWAWLTPWRELTAQFFDAPSMVPYLAKLSQVTVAYETTESPTLSKIEAYLLVSWLAVRLGWQPTAPVAVSEEAQTFTLTHGNAAPIKVTIQPTDALGIVPLLTLEGAHARFTVSHGLQSSCAVAHAEVDGMAPIERAVGLEQRDEISVMVEELRLNGRDRGFERTLQLMLTLFNNG